MNPAPSAFDTRAGFIAALHWGFDAAMAQGARRIVCCDPDFAEWPLDDEALLQGLVAWLRQPQRRLVLLAAGFDALPRRCPRFTRWRRDWVHAIEAWQPPPELAPALPAVLVADRLVSVHLADALQWRGQASAQAQRARLWSERIDAVLQRSESAFALRTLGL